MKQAALLLVLTAATGPAAFRPGQWEVATSPGTATLDGRPLHDLPYSGPAGPQPICLSAEAAASPDWIAAGQLPERCTYDKQSLANGRVDIAATCPPVAAGLASGHVRITGTYTPTSYALRFVTTSPAENGVMGFSGTLRGRRVGDCPAVSVPPRP